MGDGTDSGPDQLPVVDGSIYGGAAFAVGYLATLVAVLLTEGQGFFDSTFEGTGWIYYNAQFVSVEQRLYLGDGVDIPSVNYLTGKGIGEFEGGVAGAEAGVVQLPAVVYHAIPVVVFVGFGFLLARSLGAETLSTGVKVGASLVFGGVLAALGGTYLFEVGNVGPNRLEGVLFAGLVYPVVCGGLGGALFALQADGPSADTEPDTETGTDGPKSEGRGDPGEKKRRG